MRTPPEALVVELRDWEHDWAVHVGTQRTKAREGSRDAAHYDPRRMQDNLTANIAATCTEMAVAKYMHCYWSGSYWAVKDHKLYKDLPDVEPNYEVKRIREPNNPLPVRQRDVKAGRTVVLGWPDPETEFRVVHLVGYISAEEGWERGGRSSYDYVGTRLVPQGMLERFEEDTPAISQDKAA